MKSHSRESISCESLSLIYIISCNACTRKCTYETTLPLHKWTNIHRKPKQFVKIGLSILVRFVLGRLLDEDSYKQVVNTRYIDKGVSFSLNTNHQCDYTSSTFCAPHHKDIIGRGSQHHKKMNKDNSWQRVWTTGNLNQ